jgi:hypothetical protein
MDSRQFYDYILEHFTLDGTSSRLINNIITYVDAQKFLDAEEARRHLTLLLGCAFGLEEREIKLYRADEVDDDTLEKAVYKELMRRGVYLGNYKISDCVSVYRAAGGSMAETNIADYIEALRKEMPTISVLLEMNAWANRCGYFYNAYLTPKDPDDESFYPGKVPSPNNGYNCRHPECDQIEYEHEVEGGIGCCYDFTCPFAFGADEEDCEAFGVEYEEGEYVVAEIPETEYEPAVMYRKKSAETE